MDASSRTLLAPFAEPRPTLPSLRSLNLPFPKMHSGISGAVFIDRSSMNYLNDLVSHSAHMPSRTMDLTR